jgi:hypothetical protein
MKVDEDTTTYSACNLCNGTDPFTGKTCQKGTYVCDCESHHGGGAKCDPTKIGKSNITEHFAPRIPSQTCNSTLYKLCGDTINDKNKCYDCLRHNWLKISFMGHCQQEDLFDFCPSDWSQCRGDKPVAWSCWAENVPRKTGGFWYSTLAAGQNKSWTVQKVKTIKEQCLKNHLMDTVESHDSKGCFKACGARNTSDACWIGCFFDTLLGHDARTSSSLPLGGMSKSQIEQSWTGAFDKCAPLEVPLTWSNPKPSELRAVPSMRVGLRDRMKSLLRSSPSPNAQCEEIFDQKECDGHTPASGRKLLGGGGGGGACTWCKSSDGAHAECFYKDAAKTLSKDWSCDQ